jgi:hypothetical protein
MSLLSFTPALQTIYLTGVSVALSVPISDLSIGLISEIYVESRRRAQITQIEVETIAEVPTDQTDTVLSSITSDNINKQITTSGVETEEISQPVLETIVEEIPELGISKCGPGTYLSFHKDICVSCPTGMYSTTVGATSFDTCIYCPVSTYSSVKGASSYRTCTSCDIGKFTMRTGATWQGQCVTVRSRHVC